MNPQELQSFLRGSLEIDCPKIELIPNAQISSRSTLCGSGSIVLTEDGSFKLKVYFPDTFNLVYIFEHLQWEAGKVIPDTACYSVKACDISGSIWEAYYFIPDRSSGPNGSIITGSLQELRKQEDLPIEHNRTCIDYYFNRIIVVPFNTIVKEQEEVGATARKIASSIRLARFTSCNINFEVEEIEGHTRLRASSASSQYSENLVNRIFEAFSFITATHASWSALAVRHGNLSETKIRAVDLNILSSRVLPPIRMQRVHINNDAWLAFDRYLSYTLSNKQDYLHPLSLEINSVIESGKASVDIQALTLSVSIEALLKSEMSHLHKPPFMLMEDIREAIRLIENSEDISPEFKSRIPGLLGGMNGIRAKDILNILSNLGLIDNELVKIYGTLRNKSAHGGRGSGSDFQNYYNRISAVLTLFYQIIFLAIGYEGDYVDYGSYGYPTKTLNVGLPTSSNPSDSHQVDASSKTTDDPASLIC